MWQKKLFYISGGGYLISSLTVLLIPLGDITGQNGSKIVAILSAVIFWISLIIAIMAQMMLRRIQKSQRPRGSLIAKILSPPTVWTALALAISLIATVILSIVNLNGFILYFCICITLLSAEWTVLSSGKYKRKDRKLVLKIYRLNEKQRSNER